MERVLQCDCGFKARGRDEDRLAAEVRRHAWETHGMALSPDQALLLAFPAELDATALSPQPRSEGVHDSSQDVMSNREEKE